MYEFLEWRVQDVMNEPVSVEAETTLSEVELILEEHGFNAVPVVDSERHLLGIVTSLDLLKAFRFNDDSMLPPYSEIMLRPVVRVMTLQPLTVRPRTPLTRVLEKLVDTRNKSFPVVDDEKLVGMVAREDVIEALRRAEAGEKPTTPMA